jgi:hypothetical protein
MTQSPIERHMANYKAINAVFADGSDPSECAAMVAASLLKDIYRVPALEFPPDKAPKIMHELADDKAWGRFFPEESPGPQRWVWELKRLYRAAHAVFSAVGHVADPDATALLFKKGKCLMADILAIENRRED